MSGEDLAPGQVRVFDNYVPELEVGDYLVNVTQRINPVVSGSEPIDESHAISQPFSVSGPRFTLPPGEVFSVFPAPDAVGPFHQLLPHVVLTHRELPWERNVFADTDPSQQTPWLALLLFVDGEQIDGQPTLLRVPGSAKSRTMAAPVLVSELFAAHDGSDKILWPDLTQEWYEANTPASATANVIDLSAAAWKALVASPADLRYLAHAREVDVTAKDDSVLGQVGDGWYSVVVANRVPDAPGASGPGRRNIAHLVSLEGLNTHVGTPLAPGVERVRMVALKSWSFSCLAEPAESFAGLVSGLERNTRFALSTTAPLANTQVVADAKTALARGYVPLSYGTRLGEQTFGWYRGPFSPAPVAGFTDTPGRACFSSASAALVYDKQYGVFDLSYAVAWDTGRALALADGAFSQALLRWQLEGTRMVDRLLERDARAGVLGTDAAAAAWGTTEFVADLLTERGQQLSAPTATITVPTQPTYRQTRSPVPEPETVAALLEQPEVRQAVRTAGAETLEVIAAWLAALDVLAGVPFETLVPHPDLLPAESIRFFDVDPNWRATLAEGALSIGLGTSRDRLYQDLMRDLIHSATQQAVGRLRSDASAPPGAPAAGLLLRSAIVSRWPGLEVHGYADKDRRTLITPLRIDRLAADVLVCLWPQVPALVTVDEPPEGIAFGFGDPPTVTPADLVVPLSPIGPSVGGVETPARSPGGLWVYPRAIDDAHYGMPLGDAEAFDALAAGAVDATSGVLRIATLLAALRTKLGAEPRVRDLAVQLVQVPEQAAYTTPEKPS